MDSRAVNFAPPAEASHILQALRQVPSIATIWTSMPFENSTRPFFRFSIPDDIAAMIQKQVVDGVYSADLAISILGCSISWIC